MRKKGILSGLVLICTGCILICITPYRVLKGQESYRVTEELMLSEYEEELSNLLTEYPEPNRLIVKGL